MHRIRAAALALATLTVVATACTGGGDAVAPGPAPVDGAGTYVALGTAAGPLPATVYVFPDEPAGGETIYRLDSAFVTLRDDGRYVRITWFSEWMRPDRSGDVPYTLVVRYHDFDHGTWARQAGQVILTSGWIQHQAILGRFDGPAPLELTQPLTPGDPRIAVRFAPR